MKFRPKNRIGSKDKAIAIILIICIGVPLSYIGGGLFVLYDVTYRATMAGEVSEDDFMDPHYIGMARMAEDFEFYLERDHLVFNICSSVWWNASKPGVWDLDKHGIDDSATEIIHIGTAGDSCMWTGMTLAAECFRYAAAKKEGDSIEQANALKMVKRILSGVSMLVAVPSGGIGPDYPALLSRSVRTKEYDGPSFGDGYDQYPDSHNKWDIFEGKGDYSDWLYKGYPSTDQHSGFFFGLGQCFKHVAENDPWVKERVTLLAAQFAEHLTRTNFMIIDSSAPGYTRTTGQDFKLGIEQSGFWILTILKLAAMTNPEKYAPLYYHWAVEKNYINFLGRDMRFFNFYNYYSLNINYVMIVNLLSLEENLVIRQRYEKIIRDVYYPIYRISRNAWFNMGYIYMMRDSTSPIAQKFQRDVEDQLMRFNVPRGVNGTVRIPERTGELNPPGEDSQYYLSDLMDPFSNAIYGPIFDLFELNNNPVLKQPRTVDQWSQSNFLWQRTPWMYENETWYFRQDMGTAYLLPYYMGRYCGLFPK